MTTMKRVGVDFMSGVFRNHFIQWMTPQGKYLVTWAGFIPWGKIGVRGTSGSESPYT